VKLDWTIYPPQTIDSTKIERYAIDDLRPFEKSFLWAQTCICLTHAVYTKCENGCVFVKTKPRGTTLSCHGSAIKVRHTCRRNLTQRRVSWSSLVVPEISVETRIRVTKGEKWAVPRRSKPDILRIFNVTTVCLCC